VRNVRRRRQPAMRLEGVPAQAVRVAASGQRVVIVPSAVGGVAPKVRLN
jgi:hypothetical protein